MMDERVEACRTAPEKHGRILRAALEEFIAHGFEGASVDDISARAGVSKATVYNHFKDKKSLFACCLLDQADAFDAAVQRAMPREAGGSVDQALTALGQAVLRLVLSPEVSALHRIIAAEVSRFPELGRALYERSVTRFRSRIAPFFAAWVGRGALELPDPERAAKQFLVLCTADLKVRIELGMQPDVCDGEVCQAVREAVQVFLRAYGRRAQ